jgi:hypothetical protein
VHVLRDARRRVQGDRGPDRFDILLRDAVASQEVTTRVFNRNTSFSAIRWRRRPHDLQLPHEVNQVVLLVLACFEP